MLRVLALSTLPSIGAGTRLRVAQYAPLLRGADIELELFPLIADEDAGTVHRPGHTTAKIAAVLSGALRRVARLLRSGDYELLLVYRESMPIGPPLIEAIWDRLGRPYVIDFDDAIYLGEVHPANRRWAWLRHPSRVARAVRGARAVTVSTAYLADWARRYSDDVTVLPTAVDTTKHLRRPPHVNSGPLVIGWTGSDTTAPYLHELDGPLTDLGQERAVTLKVIGGDYAHPSVTVIERPFTIEGEPAEIATFDVGVLPQPDDPWTRGKSGYKAQLYMAAGVPVVASRQGANTDVVVEAETGYCVGSRDEWVARLRQLADDPPLRERMGDAGRVRVEERYSLAVLAPRLAEVLRRAAGRPT